jgi:hypothetical protein
MAMSLFAADQMTIAIPKIPDWILTLIGGGGIAGAGVWGIASKKISQAFKLYEDMKIFVNETVDVANTVKAEIKNPTIVKEWNEWIDSVSKLLIDTENKSCISKAELLQKKKLSEVTA